MGLLDNLRGFLFGRALPPTPAAAPMFGELPLHQQFQRIGGSKTPRDVSAIIRQADIGKPCRLVDLSNDCRQLDCRLSNNLWTRENSLGPLELVVEPWKPRNDKEPADKDKEVADFVEDALLGATGNGDDTKSLTETIAHLQSAIYIGYAADEIDWQKRNSRYLVPAGFWPIDQRRFEFRLSDGRLIQQDQWGRPGTGVDLQRDLPGKCLVHQPRVNGDVPAREGLNKLLVWPATFRNWTTADWLALAELSWKPWRLGKYPKGTGGPDIDNLRDALRWMTSNGIAAIRDDHKLEIFWPKGNQGGKSNHLELAEWLGMEMTIAILGQTLTTAAGDRGARSLGDVHDRVRKDIREFDAQSVASTLVRDLVRWIVWLNFGPETALPLVYFNTDDATDLAMFAGALKDLKDAQLRVPAKWCRQEGGIPEPEDGEELLGDWEDVDTEELDEAA